MPYTARFQRQYQQLDLLIQLGTQLFACLHQEQTIDQYAWCYSYDFGYSHSSNSSSSHNTGEWDDERYHFSPVVPYFDRYIYDLHTFSPPCVGLEQLLFYYLLVLGRVRHFVRGYWGSQHSQLVAVLQLQLSQLLFETPLAPLASVRCTFSHLDYTAQSSSSDL